jgi:hypothetical protein
MKSLKEIIVELDAVRSQTVQLLSDLQALSDSTSPAPTPTDVEIDVVLSDGTTKKFVPQA